MLKTAFSQTLQNRESFYWIFSGCRPTLPSHMRNVLVAVTKHSYPDILCIANRAKCCSVCNIDTWIIVLILMTCNVRKYFRFVDSVGCGTSGKGRVFRMAAGRRGRVWGASPSPPPHCVSCWCSQLSLLLTHLSDSDFGIFLPLCMPVTFPSRD